uniref:Apple domain-containing protein n=1 Tax=Meloidogyne javanica TaxID=6303 RepID=A0A915N0D9_MELJA
MCYSFAPGLTILGADYRRDFGLSRRQCADVCKTDVCCMAFEWQRIGGQCTLKSRSLNGTVVNLGISNVDENAEKSNDGKDLLFALCLDYGDSERDRFWDHELGGPIVATKIDVERENCAKFPKIEKSLSSGKEAPAVIYNWRPVDPTDMESPLGECQCISVLQHIKLNFGSFSGFLI